MVNQTGIVKGFEVRKNKDGNRNVIMLQVQMSDIDDIQTIQFMSHVGQDEIPANESVVTIIKISSSFKIAIASDDLIESSVLQGDKKIYSSDGGVIKSFVNFLKTGILELNGNNDFAVRYTALQTAFDQLKDDFDNHVHQYIPGDKPPAPTETIATPSTADITGAKVEEVKII